MRDPVMRVRCPKDTDPEREHEHLALDVRLPLLAEALGLILAGFPSCPCGAELVMRAGSRDDG